MSNLVNLQGQPWTPGPIHPEIVDGEVHIWRVNLDLDESVVNQCRFVLSDDETARAEAFRFDLDRNRWIVARGLLRVVLGRYLYMAPKDVEFQHGVQNKPALTVSINGLDLRFNISHSDEVALFAVAAGREVGVDVERIRTKFASESVASQVFSEAEMSEWSARPDSERCESFFAYWTCKEAYVKALGIGLTYPMARFSVQLSPVSSATIVIDQHRASEKAGAVTVQRLTVGPEHCAAVALLGDIARLRCWHGPVGVPIGLWKTQPQIERSAA